MFPLITLFGLVIQTKVVTAVVCFISIVTFLKIISSRLSKPLSNLEICYFVGISLVVSWFGSKLGSMFFETSITSLQGAWNELLKPGGRAVYGGLVAEAFCVYMITIGHKDKQELRWTAVSCAGLAIFILRLQCFADGCCWGKITDVPWAVVYTQEASVMPLHGVPVHPTQIYEALLGLSIFLFAPVFRKWTSRPWIAFFVPYALGRFVIEFFRGDAARGENIIWILSTSQLMSVLVLSIIALAVFRLSA